MNNFSIHLSCAQNQTEQLRPLVLKGMLKPLMSSSLMMFEEVNTFQTFELNLHYQTTHF